MTRIEVVTYDYGTGHTQVDQEFAVEGIEDVVIAEMIKDAEHTAALFASEDHSTDHAVYVRTV